MSELLSCESETAGFFKEAISSLRAENFFVGVREENAGFSSLSFRVNLGQRYQPIFLDEVALVETLSAGGLL